MTARHTPGQSPSRRDRRAAARRGEMTRRPARPAWRTASALTLTTLGAVLAGVVVIAFLVLQNQPGAPAGVIQPPIATTPPALAHGRMLGSPAAPVKLDVYSDFQCPNCEVFWTTIEPTIVRDEVATGRVQLVYHDFAFIGPESLSAAVAARCADRQGKFWPYHDLLYANQGRENSGGFSDARLVAMAQQAGLDTAAWSTCRADPAVTAAVQQELKDGQARGVNGTPMLFVNGTRLPSYDVATIQSAIDSAIGSSTPAPVP